MVRYSNKQFIFEETVPISSDETQAMTIAPVKRTTDLIALIASIWSMEILDKVVKFFSIPTDNMQKSYIAAMESMITYLPMMSSSLPLSDENLDEIRLTWQLLTFQSEDSMMILDAVQVLPASIFETRQSRRSATLIMFTIDVWSKALKTTFVLLDEKKKDEKLVRLYAKPEYHTVSEESLMSAYTKLLPLYQTPELNLNEDYVNGISSHYRFADDGNPISMPIVPVFTNSYKSHIYK